MARYTYFPALFLVLLLAASIFSATAKSPIHRFDEESGGLGYGTTREEILANRERRKKQLKSMILSLRQQLADHSAGETIMTDSAKASAEKRMQVYQMKLDTMAGEMDERDVERMIQREELRQRSDRARSRSREL